MDVVRNKRIKKIYDKNRRRGDDWGRIGKEEENRQHLKATKVKFLKQLSSKIFFLLKITENVFIQGYLQQKKCIQMFTTVRSTAWVLESIEK